MATDEEIARDEVRWRAMVLKELRGIIYTIWAVLVAICIAHWPW